MRELLSYEQTGLFLFFAKWTKHFNKSCYAFNTEYNWTKSVPEIDSSKLLFGNDEENDSQVSS